MSANTVEVRDNPQDLRFEARIDGALVGFAEYRLTDTHIVFTHTEVDPAFGGRGIGGALARGALDAVRAGGTLAGGTLAVRPRCSFIEAWIEKHPDYADLLTRSASAPTTATDILRDAFGRVAEEMPELLRDLPAEVLLWRPDPDANSIGWLAWHLTRVQDDHLAGVGEREQVWTSQGFVERFALPYAVASHGFGQSSAEVGAFHVTDATLLIDYHQAVHAMTLEVLDALDDAAYQRVVDTRFTPPVTAAVRLVSVIGDTAAHLGQIGYLKGLAVRARH
ncbi:MAG: GNAT family N-acetyltransferase [Tetrasphaera sp.]|nr:GNAT family N-acetyltransferase [Tetrasphaera sp.]